MDWNFVALAAGSGVFLLLGELFRRAHHHRERRYHGDTVRAHQTEARELAHRLIEQMEDAPPDTLTCPRCGYISHNRNDVLERYCGFCQVFLEDAASFSMMSMSPAERDLARRLEAGTQSPCPYVRKLPDGRALAVVPFLGGGILRICYDGDPHAPSGLETVWAYESLTFAINAAATWDPAKEREPYGWIAHLSSGRRRPHGNRKMEYARQPRGQC